MTIATDGQHVSVAIWSAWGSVQRHGANIVGPAIETSHRYAFTVTTIAELEILWIIICL